MDDYTGRRWNAVESNCFTLINEYLLKESGFDFETAVLDCYRDRHQITADTIHDLIERLRSKPSLPAVYDVLQNTLAQVGDRSSWMQLIQPGDVLAFSPSHGWPLHMGIMLNLEQCEYLHHPICRRSQVSILDEESRRSLFGVYRVPTIG